MATDEEKNFERERRSGLLEAVILGSVGVLAAIDGSILFYSIAEGDSYGGVPFAEFSILPAFFIFLYALARRGFSAAASWLLVAGYAAGVGYAAYEWGADLETTVLSFAIVGVIGAFLLGSRGGLVFAAAAGAAAIPLWYAQWHHVVPAFGEPLPNAAISLAAALIYILVVAVIWRKNSAAERSLGQALDAKAEIEERLRASELEKIDELYRFAEFGRLSSGLFHDLLNIMNGAALENEVAMKSAASGVARDKLAEASRASERIKNFAEGIRRQLASKENKNKVSLAEIVAQAIGLLEHKAKIAGASVLFEHDADDRLVWFGNEFKLHQVAMNLISNAIESGGRNVAVKISRDGGYFVLTVSDDGRGIAPSIRESIFEPFFTTKDGSDGAARGGMGLGLAIVKRIVENELKGMIVVASEEGKGTAFSVRFPMRPLMVSDWRHRPIGQAP